MKFEKCKKTGKSRPILMCSQEFSEKIKNLGYTTPTLITGYGAYYYCCDRDPGISEPDIYSAIPDFLFAWWNQTDCRLWWCLNNADGTNLLWQTNQIGLQRDWVSIASPSVNTAYQPSTTNDSLVCAVVSISSALTGDSEFIAQIDAGLGSGYLTVAEASVSGVVITLVNTLTFQVPVNGMFKLVPTNGLGASSSIVQIKTLIL